MILLFNVDLSEGTELLVVSLDGGQSENASLRQELSIAKSNLAEAANAAAIAYETQINLLVAENIQLINDKKKLIEEKDALVLKIIDLESKHEEMTKSSQSIDIELSATNKPKLETQESTLISMDAKLKGEEN